MATAPSTRLSGEKDRVIVLANRAPFRHEFTDGRIVTTRSASGLVTALEPLLEAYSGTWVAHAAGTADSHVVDSLGGIDVPPANPRYRVRYVPVPEDEFRGYYLGFANEGLWPLCHNVNVAPTFRRADYERYRAANARFAGVVQEEAGTASPIVLVQDYHFALAPRMLRQQLAASRVVTFWHIPFPRPRTFRQCPWALELLEGLLGSDIIGFQTDEDCRSFFSCIESITAADVDLSAGTVRYRGRITKVRAYPVGVDCADEALQSVPRADVCREQVCRALTLPAGVRLGVGVDRMDYTKGINEKFLAIERLLESQPDLIGKFAFVQIAEPSRDCIAAYRQARGQAVETSRRINARFGVPGHAPIRFLEQHHETADVCRYYRAADFCYVGSLHDGMNLVAKEFVAARDDERGVLVLSERAGAARQLRAALLVDPVRIDHAATVLSQAVRMPAIEQQKRMRLLRANVTAFDATWWARQMIDDAVRHEAGSRWRGADKQAAATAVA